MPLDQYVHGRPWYVEGTTVPQDPPVCPDDIKERVRTTMGEDVYRIFNERWGPIRTHFWETTRGIRSVYNLRLISNDGDNIIHDFITQISNRCSLPFALNASVSCILMSKVNQENPVPRFRYFHGSEHNGSMFERKLIVRSPEDITDVNRELHRIQEHIIEQEKSDAWSLVDITNISLYIHHIVMGGGNDDARQADDEDDDTVTRVSGEGNMCLFRCIAKHLDIDPAILLDDCQNRSQTNGGVQLEDLPRIEETYGIGIDVVQKAKCGVKNIIQSKSSYPKMKLLLSQDHKHVDLINDFDRFKLACTNKKCPTCLRTCSSARSLTLHSKTCRNDLLCETCNTRFYTLSKFRKHTRSKNCGEHKKGYRAGYNYTIIHHPYVPNIIVAAMKFLKTPFSEERLTQASNEWKRRHPRATVDFEGLKVAENIFSIRIDVMTLCYSHELKRNFAQTIIRTSCQDVNRPRMILHCNSRNDMDDVHLIEDMDRYTSTFICSICGSWFHKKSRLDSHKTSCQRATKYEYKGGPYYSSTSVFDEMEKLGVIVPEPERFNRYHATFDLEAYLTPNVVGNATSKHIPMSVSVGSNVPTMEGPTCMISDGNTQKLIDNMMSALTDIADTTFRIESERYSSYIQALQTLIYEENEEIVQTTIHQCNTNKNRPNQSRTKKILDRLIEHISTLPVVGFNSSRYDLPLIKPYLARHLMGEAPNSCIPAMKQTNDSEDEDVVEEDDIGDERDRLTNIVTKNNSVTCIRTKRLLFLDVLNYLSPGTSYANYLKAYGGDSENGKSFFPYEYVDSLDKLRECALPPYESFYSSIKGANTLEEGTKDPRVGERNYEMMKRTWTERGMSTMRDWLEYYNNQDVGPFITALDNHVAVMKDLGLDLLKDAITLPGLALRFAMKPLQGIFFTIGPDQIDVHKILKDNLVGGPCIVFNRYAMQDETTIRCDPEYVCRRIIGFDANSLYPYAMATEMPVGPCVTRSPPDFTPRCATTGFKFSQTSLEWLEYEEQTRGYKIIHAGNGPEVVIGSRKITVDGFAPNTGIAFLFNGCFWHACQCLDASTSSTTKKRRIEDMFKMKVEDIRRADNEKMDYIARHSSKLIVMRECEWNKLKRDPMSDVNRFMRERAFKKPPARAKACDLPPWNMKSSSYTENELIKAVLGGKIFGALLVDICTPPELTLKFHDLPPIFKHADVSPSDAGPFMEEHQAAKGRTSSRTLISSYYGKEILVTTPLLKWYIEKGLRVTKVYLCLEWAPRRCFDDLVQRMAQSRRKADEDPAQKIIGESYKLLANSVYGKCIENKSKFIKTYLTRGKNVFRCVNLSRYRGHRRLDMQTTETPPCHVSGRETEYYNINSNELEGPTDIPDYEQEEEALAIQDEGIYEMKLAPRKVTENLPIQLAIFVYQMAKLRMLQFRYDLLEIFFDKRKWQQMYMDTDSLYLAMSVDSLDEALKEEKRRAYYLHHHEWFPSECCDTHREDFVSAMCDTGSQPAVWLPRQKCCQRRHDHDQRTPGLFKTEFSGSGMVCLCPKTYYCIDNKDRDDVNAKYSSKGINRSTNKLLFEHYLDVLRNGVDGSGINRGIRVDNKTGSVITYGQVRRGLTFYYAKRKLRDDGVSTDPLNL